MITVIYLRDSPFVGGPEKQILGQCARLDKSRFEPVIASFTASGSNPLLEAAVAAGIRAEALPDGKLALPSAVKRLRGLFASDRRCVVISSGFKADFTARLACAGALRQAQDAVQGWVLNQVQDDVIGVGRVYWIAWFHGFTAAAPRVRLYEALDMLAARRADAIVAVCERSAKELRARGLPNVKTAPNAVDAAAIAATGTRESAREELGIRRSEPVVGIASRLSIEKGIRYFIDSAARVLGKHPHTRFLIIGDGPLRTDLQRQAERLGISGRFIFTGLREDCVALMKAMDVFVLPSLRENLPVALLEAMACGVSVVATDVGGVGEALERTPVEPIRPGSAAAITDAVTKLLNEPELRANCSAALRNRARDFSFDRQVELMETAIQEVCDGLQGAALRYGPSTSSGPTQR